MGTSHKGKGKLTFCPYPLSRQAEGERPVSSRMKLENEDNEL